MADDRKVITHLHSAVPGSEAHCALDVGRHRGPRMWVRCIMLEASPELNPNAYCDSWKPTERMSTHGSDRNDIA